MSDVGQTVLTNPRIVPLPAGEWNPPSEDFSFVNIKNLGIGTVVCAPKDWHMVEAQDPFPDMMLHDDIARRWVFGKQNLLDGSRFLTGVVFRNFRYLIATPHDLIEQFEQSLFGDAHWYFAQRASTNKPYDKQFLLDGYGVEPLGQSIYDHGNFWKKSVELNLYQRSEDESYPLCDFYTYSDIFYWRKERWVMSVSYQCPLGELEETKPIFDAIRNNSVINQPSPLYRVVYSDYPPVAPFPKE